MRTALALGIALAIGGLGVGRARAEPPEPERVTSYRAWTLGADALSIGSFLVGGLLEGPGGRDTVASERLMTAGLLGATFATPIIHGVRGHLDRAVGSFFLRGGLAAAGGMIGVTLATPCDGLLCELDGLGPGVTVGLVVASLIDAAYQTDEREAGSGWAPQVVVAGDRFQLGVATRF